jgi:hypothetical protein
VALHRWRVRQGPARPRCPPSPTAAAIVPSRGRVFGRRDAGTAPREVGEPAAAARGDERLVGFRAGLRRPSRGLPCRTRGWARPDYEFGREKSFCLARKSRRPNAREPKLRRTAPHAPTRVALRHAVALVPGIKPQIEA